MFGKMIYSFLLAAALVAFPAVPVSAAPAAQEIDPCIYAEENGSLYLICVPPVGWNSDLVVFAHGYVDDYTQPVPYLPLEQLNLGGIYLPETLLSMGYAFAMTSYPVNGLAILPGVQSVRELVSYFKALYEGTGDVFLVGASEGALVTTLALEQYPDEFSGGMAVCGPIGNFQGQVNHFGDFRAVFDYFFKNVLPPSAVKIPKKLIDNWTPYYTGRIAAAMQNTAKTSQLFSVTGVPYDSADPASAVTTAVELLWYNVFATNDAQEKDKLGGNPYDNRTRWYFGSLNDFKLNRNITRYKASRTALRRINDLQTSGKLVKPLVTMHTTGDPIVPYWHEPLYTTKTLLNNSALLHINIPVIRYGHCNFEVSEVMAAFSLLNYMAAGDPAAFEDAEQVMPTEKDKEAYRQLIESNRPEE